MKKFLKNYWFILCMLAGIVAGCLVGAFAPSFGSKIEFLGTLFINMMFCVVVPMVFCSIASAIANMKSVKRAGKIMGVTIATFLVTAAIAGILIKAFWVYCPKWVSSILYIGMGWTCVLAFTQIFYSLSPAAFGWLLAGGIIYTIGGIIYALKLPIFNSKHKNFGSHEIFHLFVMAGSACHFIVMYCYLI